MAKLENKFGHEGMTKAFRLFDTDHSNQINSYEFRNGLKMLGR